MTVKILWVSRHPPLPAQILELKRKFGDVEVVHFSGRVPDADFVVHLAEEVGAQIVVPVLPLSIIAAILNSSKNLVILYAQMREVHKGPRGECERAAREKPDRRVVVEYAGGVCRVFEFVRFERVKAVKLETEPL
ncbi:MAG: hypothetical protein QXJ59_06695 [Thermofilaceae archaeon]